MARLPIPGSDDGVWGQMLNEFLTVDHNPDGTIKETGTIAEKADNSDVVHLSGNETISGIKTFVNSPIVPTPTTDDQAVTKQYVDDRIPEEAPDATTMAKGVVQLSGDLSGTADAPTIANGSVTNTKISDSAAIAQSKIAGLTNDLSSKIDATDAVALSGDNQVEITNPSLTHGFMRIDLNYTQTDTAPDALAFYHNGVRTGYHNEKGELRARPAANNSVPFRVQQRSSSQTADLTQWTTSGNNVLSSVAADGTISAPNIDRKVSYSALAPDSPREGDLWIVP